MKNCSLENSAFQVIALLFAASHFTYVESPFQVDTGQLKVYIRASFFLYKFYSSTKTPL